MNIGIPRIKAWKSCNIIWDGAHLIRSVIKPTLHQQTFIITCWLDQHMLTRMHTHTCTPMRMQTYIRKQIHALEAYRRTCVFVTHFEMVVFMKPTYTRAHVGYETPTDTQTDMHAHIQKLYKCYNQQTRSRTNIIKILRQPCTNIQTQVHLSVH
jgi:hypothetical protein